jgi:hypothetical protein
VGVTKGIGCDLAMIFRQQNLARNHEYLAEGCHLYVVCRRPKTYVDYNSVRIFRGRIRGRFVVETSTKRETSRFCAPFLIDSDEKLRWTDGGTTDYYQIVGKGTGERYLEGDTWAFALLSSRCRADLAQQEVLYVGKRSARRVNGRHWTAFSLTAPSKGFTRSISRRLMTFSLAFCADLSGLTGHAPV